MQVRASDVKVKSSVSKCKVVFGYHVVGGSAITPASAARNCAVDRRIAEPIGVTDARVQ